MKTILVVEDAQSLRKDILEMLGFEGYTAHGAENGLIGVERARELLPDLIICDIMMPGMDGFEVLETLRRDPATATIPFIFLTARADRVDVRQGMELGADDFLPKPFTAAELLKSVHTRIEKRARIDALSQQRLETLRGNIVLALPHELRTPLSAILGFSDLLMDDAANMDSRRVADMARLINESGMRLYRLVENFLTYAHTEIIMTDRDRAHSLREGYMLFPKVTIETTALLRARALGREADLQLELIEADVIGIIEDYLKKIVEELLENACKFSPAGTPVRLRTFSADGFYGLEVIDQGRGMTQQQIESIGAYMQFERRVYEQQGAGLGLIICQRLAQFHGGDLTVASTVGAGTRVVVRLPIRTDIQLHS